jgi:hypothetical protein
MRKRRWRIVAGLLVAVGVGAVVVWFSLFSVPEIDDGDYLLQAVSVFEEDSPRGCPDLTRGQRGWWNAGPDKKVIWVAKDTDWKTVPHPEVTAYPELKSTRPLYGAIEFGKDPGKSDSPTAYHFLVDESQGTGKGYDRFYFDVNRDRDLTNDPVLVPHQNPPQLARWNKCIVFPPMRLPFDFGPDDGTRSVEIEPRLDNVPDQPMMLFVATEARKGRIQIGRHRFEAFLAQPWIITARYDVPGTELYMTPTWFLETGVGHGWVGEESLSSFQLVDGRLFQISATPTGDLLKVRRYRGEMGVLRIAPGNRKLAEVGMSGSLSSATTIVPIGRAPFLGSNLNKVQECQIPVGDYCPNMLGVRYGRLAISLSNNYHLDGQPYGAIEEPRYGIAIRKDRPFVLDFSNRPEVMFASPAKDQTFKPGDKVEVEAVLVDPVQNAMIRNLRDTSRKMVRKSGDQTYEMDLSLDPTVTILDASGKTVAEGKMPFG